MELVWCIELPFLGQQMYGEDSVSCHSRPKGHTFIFFSDSHF